MWLLSVLGGANLIFQGPGSLGPMKVSDALLLLSHCAENWGPQPAEKRGWYNGDSKPSYISVYSCDFDVHCRPPTLGIL